MNYHNPQLLDELAAHYALGTLRGPARQRFARLCQQIPEAMQAVQRWEDRLLELARDIAPVKPPAIVWQKVRQRLGHARVTEQSSWSIPSTWWHRTQLAFAAGVAVFALSMGVWTLLNIATTDTVALFADQQQTELWRVEARTARDELVVTRSATLALDDQQDYELWALPDSGAAPVSLGLMPKSGKRALALTAAQRLALAGASKIAISLEPIGGSPIGTPTGPVLYVTNVARVG
jgi:anti-sigma-K factor RskA